VAAVAGKPISKSSYEHWLLVEQALSSGADPGQRALGFLITNVWLEDEAHARGISVSQAQVDARLSAVDRHSFPVPGALQAFLARSHESRADLLARVRGELQRALIASQVAGSGVTVRRSIILADFEQSFQQRWKNRTTCLPIYVMEDCSEYKAGRPRRVAASPARRRSTSTLSPPTSRSPSSSSSSPSSSSSSSSSSSNSRANSTGEVYSAPGGMTLTSPAFERNGVLPARYTCDGANASPPLRWSKVPAHAAALVLFEIDDGTPAPAGGIRWLVADINPSTKGVEAGAMPEGGILGTNMAGQAGYGGICPPRGKATTIEFVLLALNKRLPLAPGFTSSLVESEYGAGRNVLGQPAVTYAYYHRP